MRDIAVKADNVGDTLSAGDFNAMNEELENIVTSSDQTLDPAGGPDTDKEMLGKAAAAYANAGSTYSDSGAANSYVLGIATNLKAPTKYFDNMTVRFRAGNTNTGASTINVSSLGSKALVDHAGAAIAANVILANQYYTATYVLASDHFRISGRSGGVGIVDNADAVAITIGTDEKVTFSNQILSSIGTVGIPGLSFTGDTDTGLYHVGVNSIGVTAGGAQVTRFETTGQQWGTFSATGVSDGKFLNPSLGILQSSRSSSVIVAHQEFYNTNGLVSDFATEGTSLVIRSGGNKTTKFNSDGSQEWGTFSATGASYGKTLAPPANYALRSSVAITNNESHLMFYNPNGWVGSISTTASATAYNTSSDYRLKENLTALNGWDVVKNTPVWQFNFKSDPTKTVGGWMAHELQALCPEAVTGEKDAFETVQSCLVASNGLVAYRDVESEQAYLDDQVSDEPKYEAGLIWHASYDKPVYQQVDQAKTAPYLWAATQELITKAEKFDALSALLVTKGVLTQAEVDAL